MKVLSQKETYTRIGVSRTKHWEMIRDGEFPKPIQITQKRKGFIESEVDAWIEARIAEREEATFQEMVEAALRCSPFTLTVVERELGKAFLIATEHEIHKAFERANEIIAECDRSAA